MHVRRFGVIGLLALLLGAAMYGVLSTRAPVAAVVTARARSDAASIEIDESSLRTVQALLRTPIAPEEQDSANAALRLADREADLAFAQSVWRMAARPRAATPAARAIDSRLQSALQSLAADQATVSRDSVAAARPDAADAPRLKDELELARAMATLDQDEVDDARQDLVAAGGNPQSGFDDMIRQHDAASEASDTLRIAVAPLTIGPGLLQQLTVWRGLRDREHALARASSSADSTASAFQQRHDSIEARASQRLRDPRMTALSHDSTTSLLAEAQRQTIRQKVLTTLDRRVADQQQLAAVLAGWGGIVRGEERVAENHVLRSVSLLLAILLAGVLLSHWAERTAGALSIDRRRAHTLRIVGRVALQVVGLLLMLLVIFGPPSNLGTFLGLAAAGLTVALQDLIVSFLGWFVLMGRDGVRPGDLVEINGVTGEVVELGLFRTVLLETGAWSGSSHPTGRRVTFANSFAIEGHYFNFSTTGQWLWDEIEIVAPEGRAADPIAEALRGEAETATAESARQAEAEWKGTRRAPHFATLAAAPMVSLKPVPGGVEIGVRYVTRLSERAAVRGRLYRAAMDLLGTPARGPSLARAESDAAQPVR